MKKYVIEITVFLCGAIGMVLELIAARVLSPYVGSSNLVWTTIIGVMLTSMSIGYWIGGKIADKDAHSNRLSSLILLGAIFTSLIPILETILVKTVSALSQNLVLVAMVSATVVFGIPSFVLATVSPYAVKLKDKQLENIGKLSGKISSLSTIGSIFGTFIAGFVLIPTFGVRSIILGTTILLVVLSIVLYENKTKKYYGMMVILVISLIMFNLLGRLLFTRNNKDIIEDVNSQYSRIWVKTIEGQDISYKTLQVDTGLESYINEQTGEMGSEYLYYYDLFEYFQKDATHTLLIGGAAYTYPTHYLNKFQDKTIDVSEIDSKMTELAVKQFNLDINNPRLRVYHQDGRSFLNYTKNKYDCILIDAFKGVNAPFELTTYEAMQNARNKLNDNGIVIANILSAVEGKKSDFIQYEYATYRTIFDEVKVFRVPSYHTETERQNLILVGIKGKINNNEEKKDIYNKLLETELTDFSSDKKIVTDNYAPIGN